MTSPFDLPAAPLLEQYGEEARLCSCANDQLTLVFSRRHPFDLVELEQLLEAVGWSRRPVRRVRKALANSLLTVGLWRHDPRVPRLVGFARCTGDGVFEATVWDVAVHPLYQGSGLGSQLMVYVLEALEAMGTERVSLFAYPGVVHLSQRPGSALVLQQHLCAFRSAS